MAATTDSIPRQRKIDLIRTLIRQENITPEEIDLPHTFDLTAVCTALSSFPIKITPLKLTIMLALGSNQMTQQQLTALTGAEQTTLSHALASLREQGYITRSNAPILAQRLFTLAPQGSQIFNLFIKHYYTAVDALAAIQKNCTT